MSAPVVAVGAWIAHHPVFATWAAFTAVLTALAAQIEPHQTALAISLIGGAVIGLVVLAIRSIGGAIVEQMERRATGVSGQLKALAAQADQLRASLARADAERADLKAEALAANERFARLAVAFNERTGRSAEASLIQNGILARTPLPEPEDSAREGAAS